MANQIKQKSSVNDPYADTRNEDEEQQSSPSNMLIRKRQRPNGDNYGYEEGEEFFPSVDRFKLEVERYNKVSVNSYTPFCCSQS